MGYYVAVFLSMSFDGTEEDLKTIASKSLVELKIDYGYTKTMLKMVVENPGKYIHYGNKGDMFVWGGVWNYYNVKQEEAQLKAFLSNCWNYRDKEGEEVFFDFDRALLIVNREQSEQSDIYQFSTDEDLKEIIITYQGSDLCWNQY